MLSLEFRPRTFAQMAGQDLVKKSLLHISQDPANAPKTILLCGAFGSGKTTAARIFARALNCPHKLPNGDACGECEFCKSDIQTGMFYSEYDSAIVGNVNSIKELRNTFYFGYSKGYKVIVLDEVHLVSKQAQGALLKILEEPEPNVFYILCTTDPDKLLPTITSRSYELRYNTVSPSEMIPFLKRVLTERGIPITDDIEVNLKLIAERSYGHMRNAMMLLDSMLLLKEDFKETVQSSRRHFITLLTASLNYNSFIASGKADVATIDSRLLSTIDKLNEFSMKDLKNDYMNLVRDITKACLTSNVEQDVESLALPFKHSFALINILNDPVIYDSFKNTILFQVNMLSLSSKLKNLRR